MPTTPNWNLWSPSDSDDWDLTVDLAASMNSVDAALVSLDRRTIGGTITFGGNGTGPVTATVTFPQPFTSTPKITLDNYVLQAGVFLVAGTTSKSATGFTARMMSSNSGGGFSGSYSVDWIATL